jgi:hypothetical protein
MSGMNRHDERGATLVEAMVAGSLLVTLAAGAATLILLGHTLGIQTEQSMTATALATARLEALRAIPWDYGSGGVAPDVPALAPSPSTVLDASTSGYSETLDDSGRPVGSEDAGAAAFERRWAIWPVASASGESRAIEVCVFAWPTLPGAPPLVCLQSARTRQP